MKHPGTFQLKVENTCYDPFTTNAFTASADGSHNAGALQLTLGDEPAGTDRYSITQKSLGNYKLTVTECVRAIGNNEFSADGTIIKNFAVAEGGASLDSTKMITEITLPSTLRSIGEKGLASHTLMSGTLTIPRNVETIAKEAFIDLGGSSSNPVPPTVVFETGSRLTTISDLGFTRSRLKDFMLPENLKTIEIGAFLSVRFSFSTAPSGTLIIPAEVSKIVDSAFTFASGITAVDIRSDRLAKPTGATMDFPLGKNLFQFAGITSITLPQKVYTSYRKSQLQAIFGSTFTNYRKPDGTAYDFAAKS